MKIVSKYLLKFINKITGYSTSQQYEVRSYCTRLLAQSSILQRALDQYGRRYHLRQQFRPSATYLPYL